MESGPRLLRSNKLDVTYALGNESYKNRLNIFPITLSSIYKISIPNSKTIPYLGVGIGVYISKWEEKHVQSIVSPFLITTSTWLKGSLNPIGVHFLSGFNSLIYYDIFLNCELRYSFIEGNWKIKDVGDNVETEFRGLNIGGVSLKIGLGYRL